MFELIPWLLGQCADLNEVRALLAKLNLVDIPFNAQLPTAKLHWLITDRDRQHHGGGRGRWPACVRESCRAC